MNPTVKTLALLTFLIDLTADVKSVVKAGGTPVAEGLSLLAKVAQDAELQAQLQVIASDWAGLEAEIKALKLADYLGLLVQIAPKLTALVQS